MRTVPLAASQRLLPNSGGLVSPGGSDRPRAEPAGNTGGRWEAGRRETGFEEPAVRRLRNEAKGKSSAERQRLS